MLVSRCISAKISSFVLPRGSKVEHNCEAGGVRVRTVEPGQPVWRGEEGGQTRNVPPPPPSPPPKPYNAVQRCAHSDPVRVSPRLTELAPLAGGACGATHLFFPCFTDSSVRADSCVGLMGVTREKKCHVIQVWRKPYKVTFFLDGLPKPSFTRTVNMKVGWQPSKRAPTTDIM